MRAVLVTARDYSIQAVHFAPPIYIRSPKMEEENELVALRREKLDKLRARGVEPFGTAFETSGDIAEIRAKFKEGDTLRAAGRITAHRDMGKSHFLDLRDATGRIQIYIHPKEVGAELIDLFSLLDLGLEKHDGEIHFAIEDDPAGRGLKRVVADFRFVRQREIEVHSERFDFHAADSIRLFFSYRHTPALVRSLLAPHGLQALNEWITPSQEEGVFLAVRA